MKKLIYILSGLVLVLLFFVACEEYYTPKLDVVPSMLVVESHLTNDPKQNFVKLSKSQNFNSKDLAEGINGATVELIESKGSSLTGIESSTGYFTFSNTPIPGETYYLRITWENDIYESEKAVMPPLHTIDTLYTNHNVKRSYRTDSYGGPTQIETPGRDICINAPITPALEYYRFYWTAILDWNCTPPMPPGSLFPPATIFGSITFQQIGLFNIVGSKIFSISDKVENHQILFIAYDARIYLDSECKIPGGWTITIDQYGISKDSYDFHEKLNQQFSAEGNLFEPVLAQVYGNIHCVTDSTKLVLGFFDLNSYRQYRYFFYSFGSGQGSEVIPHQLSSYFNISDRVATIGNTAGFREKFIK